MTLAPPPNRFAGLTCPHCGYDVRALPHPVCPECGCAFDPDAQPRAAARLAVLAWPAAIVAVCSAAWIVSWSADLALTYIRELGSWCGTGRLSVEIAINEVVPLALLIPAAACGLNHWIGRGVPVTRIATAVAVVAWLTCYVFIHYIA